MKRKKIALLGSTGSIGRQALMCVERYPERFEIVSLSAGRNAELLLAQAEKFKPKVACLTDTESAQKIKNLPEGVEFFYGENAALHAVLDEADLVFVAIMGFAGLKCVLQAINMGKDVAIANKETLVAGGDIVTNLAKEKGVNIYPVDSEHSAIWQSLSFRKDIPFKKIIITASGGAFRDTPIEELKYKKAADALKHPNWNMGAKITIDSATMMNKGLEVIEAHWLFGIPYEQIEVTVHPQSIIHSMVQFIDGSVKAQMGLPDMKLPIQYALSYPDRWPSDFGRINFKSQQPLTFEAPDLEKFRCLALAYEALGKGGNMPAIMNAANEVAVDAFLKGRIGFLDIAETIGKTMQQMPFIGTPTYDDYVATDRESREFARGLI